MFHPAVAAGKKSPASEGFREVIDWYVIPALGDRSLRD